MAKKTLENLLKFAKVKVPDAHTWSSHSDGDWMSVMGLLEGDLEVHITYRPRNGFIVMFRDEVDIYARTPREEKIQSQKRAFSYVEDAITNYVKTGELPDPVDKPVQLVNKYWANRRYQKYLREQSEVK